MAKVVAYRTIRWIKGKRKISIHLLRSRNLHRVTSDNRKGRNLPRRPTHSRIRRDCSWDRTLKLFPLSGALFSAIQLNISYAHAAPSYFVARRDSCGRERDSLFIETKRAFCRDPRRLHVQYVIDILSISRRHSRVGDGRGAGNTRGSATPRTITKKSRR